MIPSGASAPSVVPIPETVPAPSVVIVDDDQAARDSLSALVLSWGYRTFAFRSAEELLATPQDPSWGCILVDQRMPGLSGLELQRELATRSCSLPLILVSAYADVPIAVRAMQQGAVSVLEKSCTPEQIREAVETALRQAKRIGAEAETKRIIQSRLATLAPEERRVLDLILAGTPNKTIASSLGIGLRTVEARRQSIFHKMQCSSLAELVRQVTIAQN